MKVKVDGMSEKPTNTENSDHNEVPDECPASEDCAGGGLVLQNGDALPRKRHGPDKRVSIALEEIEDIDNEIQTLSDGDEIFVPTENQPTPPPRSDSHGDQLKNRDQSEGDDVTDPSSKPIPPPRTDSHSHKPKIRHMVDMLGGYEMEETFSWDHQREYLLTCMGFVNGLGCLLKASTLIVKHGGGVFFIAYVICMIIFGCPLVYLETTLGQYANGGPLTAWKVIPLFRGLGYCMVTTTFMVSTYYMTEVTWAIYYFGVALSTALGGRKLPWDFRNKSEVIQSDSIYLFQTNLPQYDSVADVSAGERTPHSLQYTWTIQYFYSNVLQFSGSVLEFGLPVWYIVLCLLLAWVCVYACLIYGPSSIGKVMYVTAPYPYIGLPVLFVFSLFHDGSLEGIRYFLSPDWKTLAGVQIWKDAAGLMFFTLSLGTGCLHTLAGYTHFHSHCFRNLVLICLCNVMGVMFGGLTMCSGLGIFGNMTNVSISAFNLTEYELGFALYPYILMNISESAALSLLFFSIIIVIGLDTLVIYVQTMVGAITEKMVDCGIGCSRLARWMVQLVLCALLSIIGLAFTTKGGVLALNFVDSYVSQICPYVVATLECCLLMYIFGARKFVHNIEDMTGHKNSPWWMCNWKFLSPCILLALIACTILFPVHVKYRDLAYPDWTEILGWCLSVLPIVCIPVCGIKAFMQQAGTFTQRLKELLRTPHGWGAGLINSHDHDDSAPDYVICHPDNHRPMHGLAMLTANLYVPQLTPLAAEEVEDLVTYMYAVYNSMLVDLGEQFDILPVQFGYGPCQKNGQHEKTGTCEKIKDPVVSSEWKTVTYKKINKSKRHLNSSSENNSTENANSKYQQNLIGKYFGDQKQKQEQKQIRNKDLTNRKEYLRLYKQKQRQSVDFKKNEKDLKRKARESSDFKKIEKEYSFASKKKKRESSDFKKNEKELKRKARESSDFKKNEQEYSLASKRKARESSDFKKNEKELKRKARESSDFKKNEQEYSLASKRKARASSDFKKNEQEYSLSSKRKARESSDLKKNEQGYSLASKRKARESSDFKKNEKELKRKARESSDFKKNEQEYSLSSKRKARESSEFKQKETHYQKASKQRARLIDEYRRWESEKKQASRNCQEFKQKEIEIQNQSKRKARSNTYRLEQERIAKQQWRSDHRNKKAETILDCQRKASKRKDPTFSAAESLRAKHKKYGSDIDGCIARFHQNISVGPLYICSCCHQTWFKGSVSEAKSLKTGNENYFTGVLSVDNIEWVCTTCRNCIIKGKVPTLSVLNGMRWPTKPKELELFPLEERLIALRIPFMQMQELPRGRQLSVKGNVVNVPVDIQPVVNALPRPFDENITVAVKLKKKMSFKSYVFSENVRPLCVLRALHWLMKGSDMYKNANVEIDQQWIKSVTEDSNEILHEFFESQVKACSKSNIVDFDDVVSESHENFPCEKVMKVVDSSNENVSAEILHEFFESQVKACSKSNIVDFDEVISDLCENCPSEQVIENVDTSNKNISAEEELYDSDAEEVAQENVGNIDTLLDNADIENRISTFTFAPGEGQRPLSIFQDKDSEYLCFPCIFCGQRRTDNDDRKVPVHYSDIAKCELRSQDRRAANCVPNIFFKLKKIQMKQLNDKANLAVRRCQTGTINITAAQARNSECIDSIVKNDEGYYLFKQLRNSPAYLESRKKDVYAMIRQLGLPTWFMSLSSADTRWVDLLKMLTSLNDKVRYTNDQLENLAWEKKIKLIQSDPVTCSRYFDHRVKEFINTVLKSEHEPLGKVIDHFYRVEFQQRGSPHIHMIVWVENAPKFNIDSDEVLAAYVDQFLKCSIDNPYLGHLIELQIHKHSRTCRKREDKICRFGYPLPPLSKTMILEPLETEKEKYYKLYQNLQKKMNVEKDGYDMSYEEFLTNIVQMNEEEYIKCIRSSLNCSKVFLKRDPNEIRVNLYNDSVLKAWKANIDIQFVLDPYACAMYIVSYISKSQRGMSNLLHAAAKEARNRNMDLKRQVRHIGNVFSNSVEVSAQEAVYLVLQMPLTQSSRSVVFINTSLPSQRVQLLKPKSMLDELPENSTDIMSDNKIKRYAKRPKPLEKYCLADYVSELEVVYPDGQHDYRDEEEHGDDRNVDSSDEECFGDSETVLTLKNGIKIKRCNRKVIRYVRFNRKTDEENHYREKILLFHPWRNEETDLLSTFSTYKEHYESIRHMIDHKCSQYEHHAEELELARDLAEAEYDAFDDIAPSTQQVEGDDAEIEPVESEEFIYYNPDRIEHREYDIGTEIGCYVTAPQVDVNEHILSDTEYRELLQCLNSKQKQFYYHVIHWIKTKDAPLYVFLSGGAGVGKSLVIRALYQTLFRILNLKEGEDADHTRVLLCAFTGKAAFNINGSTISSAFKQKYKQSDQTLTCDSLNTFRSKYRDLSVVIIDEISMVSNSMLNFIDQRLQSLKGTTVPFGGVSIIAVGDLYQLKPVSGDWIFNDMKQDASALSRNLWKDLFTMFELTEIMRQKGDLEFSELLNRLRLNTLTVEDKTRLKQCEVSKSDPEYQKNAPHLFAENYFMHAFNDEIITNMMTEKVDIPCMDTYVSPKLSKEKIDCALKNLKNVTDPNQTANLHCSLTVVVDMIYDLTINIKTEDGLANGASCVVKLIEYKLQTTTRPSIIWVQFDDKKAGIETKMKYKNRGLYHNNINENWTPIFDVNRSFTYNRKTFQRVQFPLQPSAGRSVHRAQGSTLASVVIDLSQRKIRKVPHLHYVALSRVKSIEKLQILNFNEKALHVDDVVKTEMQRLRETAMLKLCDTSLEFIDPISHFKVAFNNCRSLNLHFDDVCNDRNLLSTHIFGFAETRLYQADDNCDYEIKGYHMIRNDQTGHNTGKRPPHGLAIYAKNDTIITQERNFSSDTLEFIMITANHFLIETQIVFLYKSPKMSDSNLTSCLNQELIPYLIPSKPLLIIGDFNIDGLQRHNIIKKLSDMFSCKMLLQDCTTDHMSMLDLVFSNVDVSSVDCTVGTCETYWSDHKTVFFAHETT